MLSPESGFAAVNPANVEREIGGVDRVPYREGRRDRGLELLRGHARRPAIGDVIADREVVHCRFTVPEPTRVPSFR